jgi:hypothetical protein
MTQDAQIEAEGCAADSTTGAVGRIVGASLAYAAPVLAAGWLFAGVRAFFISAGADPLLAALGEAPVVAFVMVYAAGWAVRLFDIAPATAQRLAMGALAALLLAVVTAIGRGFENGGHWAALAAQLSTGPGAVFALSVALILVLPLMRERGA